jgi:hypothetical protein
MGHRLLPLEIFKRDKEHPETLPVLFAEVFVVDFVCPPDAPGIPVIGIPEHFKTLVDKDVMHQEIGNPVGKDSQADGPALPEIRVRPGHDKGHADHCVEDKKGIIALEPGIVVFPVVIFVEAPQETVHDILMGKPRHKFHDTEGCQKDSDPVECLHNLHQI